MGIKFNTQQGSTISKKEKNPSFWEKDIAFLGSSFSDKKKEEFYAELAILLRSGFNLKKALELLSETQKQCESFGTFSNMIFRQGNKS